MRTVIPVFFFLSFFISSLHAQEGHVQWQDSPLKIDGLASDWGENLKYYNEFAGVRYEFRNNATHLYLVFQISDQKNQMKVMTSGIQIGISSKRKPKIKASLKLPVMAHQSVQRNEGNRAEFSGFRDSYLLGNFPVDLTGFKFSSGLVFPKGNTSWVSFAYQWNAAGVLSYEISIPIQELFGPDFKPELVSDAELTVETKLLALQNPSKASGNPREGGMSQGDGMSQGGARRGGGMGGGGMSGGGMSPGGGHSGGNRGGGPAGQRPSGDNPGMTSRFQEQSFVQKIHLSIHQTNRQ